MKKMVNIRMEDTIWRRAKAAAAAQGMTLQSWLTQAILQALAKR